MSAQVWSVPQDGSSTTAIDGCVCSAATHARITCLAIAGGRDDAPTPHLPAPQSAEVAAAAKQKHKHSAAKQKHQAGDAAKRQRRGEMDADAGSKRAPAPFTVVPASRQTVPAPEQPRGGEEDDHEAVTSLVARKQKTIKREQRKRMRAAKSRAPRDEL